MYKRSDKFTLEGNSVSELIDGNWHEIARFNHKKGQKLRPEDMALEFYSMILKT